MSTGSHPLDLARRHQDVLVLTFIVVVHLVTLVAWLHADRVNMMRAPDDFAHYWCLANLHAAMSLDFWEGTVNGLRVLGSNYPLVAQLPRAAVGLIFGPSPVVFRVANVMYLVVLLLSVYHMGRRLHGRRAGLLAAALVSLTPATYGGMRSFGLDFPAMCMTALAVLTLMRVDGFRKLGACLAFGACAGLAILAKGQSALFLIWPAAWVLGCALWRGRTAQGAARWRPLAGGAAAVLTVLLTTAVWWLGRLGELTSIMGAHTSGDGMLEVAGDITLFGGLIHYAQSLPMVLSAPLALATLLVLRAFVRGSRRPWLILIWLAVPLVLHVVLSVRHPRYIFPLAPAAALVLAVGLCSLRARWRPVATGAVAALGVAAWIACSTVSPPRAPRYCGPLCYVHHDLWDNPKPARLSDLLGSAITCGSCEYAGRPSLPQPREVRAHAARLVQALRTQSLDGRGLLVYTDGEYRVVQTMVMARQALPDLLFMDVLLAPDLLPARPPHRRRSLALWDVGKDPPAAGARRVSGPPLRLWLEPTMSLDAHLYRLDPRSGWPHPGSPD